MITGMNHTGFVVNDIDTSAEFYKSVVGLQEVARRERDGGAISQVLGYENTHIKVALLGFDGESGHVLELVQYIRPPVGERPSEERAVLGASHICFTVSDIEAAFEELLANGAKRLNPPAEVAPGRKACYLQDPDGNWVELLETGE